MTITDALFSLNGCFVVIHGTQLDLTTKLSILEAGLCNVRSVDAADAAKADAMMETPVDETGVMCCNLPQLVELAARYWSWMNDDAAAPWEDTKVEALPEGEARVAFMTWLAKLSQQNDQI